MCRDIEFMCDAAQRDDRFTQARIPKRCVHTTAKWCGDLLGHPSLLLVKYCRCCPAFQHSLQDAEINTRFNVSCSSVRSHD
ncbi:hypothetical protein D918_05869 [Trichuris suis]|nr:hypothetical protein D918_05869 [Trichuris suis]